MASVNLREKMLNVAQAISSIPKSGQNDEYSWVKAADVTNAVRAQLIVQRIYPEINFSFVTPSYPCGDGLYGSDALCTIVFHDLDSDQKLTGSGLGTGYDAGDKAPYKAMTGALKYTLKNAFLIPDSEDPERHINYRKSPVVPTAPYADEPGAVTIADEYDESVVPAPPAPPALNLKPEMVPQGAANTPIPTDEQLDAYRSKFMTLTNDIVSKGKLKVQDPGKGGKKRQDLFVKYLLHVTGAPSPRALTIGQWDAFFSTVEQMVKATPTGYADFVKLIYNVNGIAEPK